MSGESSEANEAVEVTGLWFRYIAKNGSAGTVNVQLFEAGFQPEPPLPSDQCALMPASII